VNWELLVSAVRLLAPGFLGSPMLFLKPMNTKDRGQPTHDPTGGDAKQYADMRSYLLQQSKHFVLKRLQGAAGSVPQRWYVAVHNDGLLGTLPAKVWRDVAENGACASGVGAFQKLVQRWADVDMID